jgi:gluconolactonase
MALNAQTPRPFKVVRLDPALETIISTDARGNLYSVNAVGPGEVWITSPEGKHLGTLQLPQITGEPRPRICATNVAFGDADNKGLYITACTHLFKLKASAR